MEKLKDMGHRNKIKVFLSLNSNIPYSHQSQFSTSSILESRRVSSTNVFCIDTVFRRSASPFQKGDLLRQGSSVDALWFNVNVPRKGKRSSYDLRTHH